MIPLPLAELPPGRLEPAPGVREVTGVKVDSRLVEPGDLFVAIGRGVEFLEDARARGAAATLVPDEPFPAMAVLGSAESGRGFRVTAAIKVSNARRPGVPGAASSPGLSLPS